MYYNVGISRTIIVVILPRKKVIDIDLGKHPDEDSFSFKGSALIDSLIMIATTSKNVSQE